MSFATCLLTSRTRLAPFSLSGLRPLCVSARFPSHSEVAKALYFAPSFCSFPPIISNSWIPPRSSRPTNVTVSPMLCSAPAGKSGSNWLDRLRSNKGIPTGDNLDLDAFLASYSDSVHSNSEPTQLTPKRVRNRTRSSEISAADGGPPMRSVLAELFNMGGSLIQSSRLYGKKCPRKQTNPKLFVASSVSNSSVDEKGGNDFERKDDNVSATTNSSDKDVVEKEEENLDCGSVEEEKDKDGNELIGFSKSEVTVIDTSCPVWKVDKLVFRKKNVWKVREKKGKSKTFGKKKRKGGLGLDNSNVELKRPKLSESQFRSPLELNREDFITASTQVSSAYPDSTFPFRLYRMMILWSKLGKLFTVNTDCAVKL